MRYEGRAVDGAPFDRLLIVGMGAPGGIGRVEQLLAETASNPAIAAQAVAIWRNWHPDYLRVGSALETIRTAPGSGEGGIGSFARSVASAIRRYRPSHVMYTHVNLARLGLLLGAMPWYPQSTSVWTYGVEIWNRRSALHRRALAAATFVPTISRFTAERTITRQNVREDKVRVVQLSLPQSAFADDTTGPPVRWGRILCVSRLDRTEAGKNIDALIRSMAEVRNAVPEARLVIVGDGDARYELERLAAAHGVSALVDFAGRVSDDRLTAEYQQADLFALPSEKEGFGLVFLEAMLRRTPVVGMASGGTVDVVRDGTDGVLLRRIDDLPGTLVRLLEDRARLETMRSGTRERVQAAFSPARFSESLALALAPQR